MEMIWLYIVAQWRKIFPRSKMVVTDYLLDMNKIVRNAAGVYYYADSSRRLACYPYSAEGLFHMANQLGIRQSFSRGDFFLIPRNREAEILRKVDKVITRKQMNLLICNDILEFNKLVRRAGVPKAMMEVVR